MMCTRLLARWGSEDARPTRVTIRRFPLLPADSVTVGRTIWTRLYLPHAPLLNDPRFSARGVFDSYECRHELAHVAQTRRLGLWRFLWRYLTRPTFRAAVETEARLAEHAAWPQWAVRP